MQNYADFFSVREGPRESAVKIMNYKKLNDITYAIKGQQR